MTQPADQPADQGVTAEQVIAASVIGLALIAVEARVRQDVEDTIAALYKGLAAAALLAASSAPGTVLTGLALISLGSFHSSTTSLFNTARLRVRTSVSSGYTAASQVAYNHTKDQLGDDAPTSIPELGDTLNIILQDIDTMFGNAQTGFQNTVATQFQSNNPAAIGQDILDSDGNLNVRTQAAASTAVHQGANDTLQALFNEYQLHAGVPGLMKRWNVTSSDPCGMCAALDGTLVGINAEFDHNATDNDKDYRRVWRNLLGPPRHPNCRCQLELVHT